MLLRLCQMKTLTLILTSGLLAASCAWRNEGPEQKEFFNSLSPKWFSTNPNHALHDQSGQPVPHLFFDSSVEFNREKRSVNAIVVTPKNSMHAYDLDLQSGQKYYNHTYCKQSDVWNELSGSIERPSFGVAYIPGLLDQMGEPQKILVWTERKEFGESKNINFHKVRVLGGFIEQICPEGNCVGKGNWLSKLVFVGIDAEDSRLESVNSLTEFKKKYDWKTIKAVLSNINGRNYIGEKSYPAFKISSLIEFEDAFEFATKNSIFLESEKLKKIQKSCHILYDKLWDEVGKAESNFSSKLTKFTGQYFNEISTCEKFVYHGNVNQDPEKFWFLSLMGIYFRLHRDGYYFDCGNRSWQRNIQNDVGRPVYDLKKDIRLCKDADIDAAMKFLPNFLNTLKAEKDYYRFIEYDNHTFGTHNKLYSWVKVKNRKLDCSKDPNETFRNKVRVYPEDVEWKKRSK
jgi:hypothetical protein